MRWLVVSMSVWAAMTGSAVAQTLPDDVSSLPWVVDGGVVEAAVQVGATLYLGGGFQSIARRSDLIGPVAAFDAASAQLVMADPELAGAQVNAVVSDGAGGWFAGGLFSINGQRRQLLRYDAAGRRTAWALDVGGAFSEVYTLARAGDTLYLGGNFTALAGQPRTFAAAVDIAGEAPLPWAPAITGHTVRALAVDGDDVFLSGQFTAVGGVNRLGVAAVHRITAALGGFAPVVDSIVGSLVITPSVVYAGGWFQTPFAKIAAFDRATGALAATLPSVSGGVRGVTLALSGTTLYLGGDFTMVGIAPRHGAAAIDLTTGTVLPWAPTGPGTEVYALEVGLDGVYVGGALNVAQARHAIRVNATSGTIDPAWDPAPGSLVLDFAIDGSRVVTVGTFWTYRATTARGLVGVDLAANRIVPMPGFPWRFSWITAMARRDDTLYVGGLFTELGGQPRTALAAVSLATRQVLPFAPVLTPVSFEPSVGALAIAGNDFFVGGIFTAVDGVARPSLAKLDAQTGAVMTAFAPGAFTGLVNRGFTGLSAANGRLWAAGTFTAIGGSSRAGFAAVDVATGALDPLDLLGNAPPERLSLSGDRLFLSGGFSTLQGQPRPGLASLNTVTRTLEAWTPQAFLGGGSVAANGPAVFASGVSTLHPSFGITALDAGTGVELPWSPVRAPSPDLLLDTGDGLVASTYFTGDGRPLFFARRGTGNAPHALTDVGVLVQGTRVTVRWTPAATGALPTAYALRVGSRPGASDIAVVAMPRDAGAGLVADVPPGQYFLRIVPSVNGVDGPASREFAFTTGAIGCATVPGAPSLASSGAPPLLTWTAPGGTTPTGYELRVGVVSGQLDLLRLPLSAATTSFATAGAPPGTYFVAVATVNPCGVSVLSNEVRVDIPPPGAPAPPTNLTAAVAAATVSLSWTPPAGAITGYVIEAGSAPGLADIVPGAPLGPAADLVVPGVPSGRYYVRVRALNGALVSVPSNEVVVDVP